jgi:hypothetical protein
MPRTCRVCGCTDERACIHIETEATCEWAEADLCTACLPDSEGWSHPNDQPSTLKDLIVALLWETKAALIGIRMTPMHLVFVMGVSVGEAEDIVARLSERGLIDGEQA